MGRDGVFRAYIYIERPGMEAVTGGHAEPGAVITLPVATTPASASALRAGTVLKAEVMDYILNGMVSLKIILPTGKDQAQPGMQQEYLFLNVPSKVPLPKGQTVLLEVTDGGGGGVALWFLGTTHEAEQPSAIESLARQLLARVMDTRMPSSDLAQALNALKSLPPALRNTIPELASLDHAMPPVRGLDAATLRASIEGSGLLYEARVRLAVLQGLSSTSAPTAQAPSPASPGMTQAQPQTPVMQPGAQQFAPGTQAAPQGAQPLAPDTQAAPQGAQPLAPGMQAAPQGAQPLAPGTQAAPQGAQPLAQGMQAAPQGAQQVSEAPVQEFAALSEPVGRLTQAPPTAANTPRTQYASEAVPSQVGSAQQAVNAAVQRFIQAGASQAVEQAFGAIGLGRQHIALLGQVLKGEAQHGDEAISAMIRTLGGQRIGDAYRSTGLSGSDIEIVMNVLAGKLGSSAGGRSTMEILTALNALSEGPYAAVLPRLADALGTGGVIEALKDQGITEPEIAVIINALGGRTSMSQSALAMMMQMQAGQLRRGLFEKFSEVIDTPRVSSSLRGAGLTDNEVMIITNLLAGRPLAADAMLSSTIARMQQRADLKETLLRIGRKLDSPEAARTLRSHGQSEADASANVEKVLRNIEFFQLSSRAENVFTMFLPVQWDGLRDGELTFRKKKDGGRPTYSCDVSLDMDPLGKVSFSVTSHGGSVYMTMLADRPETEAAIKGASAELTGRFAAQGIKVSAMNIGRRQGMRFGEQTQSGINIKV